MSAANNATKKRLLFQEVSFEYIIHNAQEKLFVARHQANEARSVLLVRGSEMTPNQDPGISCMRPARQIIDLGRASRSELSAANNAMCEKDKSYSIISVTTPDPTVLPPSLIANLSPSSIAIGVIRLIVIVMLSPGMHISVPSGN